MSPVDYDRLPSKKQTFGPSGHEIAAMLVSAIMRARELVESDGDRMIPITFSVPQKQHAVIKRTAANHNTSIARLVSRIVLESLTGRRRS